MYGEPDPGKIPTGSMTTFAASKRRFGRDKSRSSNMSRKVMSRCRKQRGKDMGMVYWGCTASGWAASH